MIQITTREDLGKLFQEAYKTGVIAELGVQLGYNCERILKHWKGRIIAVDNWVRIYELESAKKMLAGKPVEFLKSDTVEAASLIDDLSLDGVYIDADHSYEGLKADFYAWYGKVRVGGIIAGHDYGANNDCPGVKQFIDEFMAEHPEIKMHFTTDDFYYGEDKNIYGNEYQTWYFQKG